MVRSTHSGELFEWNGAAPLNHSLPIRRLPRVEAAIASSRRAVLVSLRVELTIATDTSGTRMFAWCMVPEDEADGADPHTAAVGGNYPLGATMPTVSFNVPVSTADVHPALRGVSVWGGRPALKVRCPRFETGDAFVDVRARYVAVVEHDPANVAAAPQDTAETWEEPSPAPPSQLATP